MRSLRTVMITAALVAVVLPISAPAGAHDTDPPAAADGAAGAAAVRSWNEVTVGALVTAAIPVPEQPLYLAYVHRAVYDAVGSVVRHDGGPGRDERGPGSGVRAASLPAAVATAAYTVLGAHFPAQQATFDQRYAAELAAVPDGPAEDAGVARGRAAAEAQLAERADDGRNGATVPLPAPGPGAWIPTPPNLVGLSSWLGTVRPFALRSPTQLRPAGPPALRSARWAKSYNETRIMGSLTSTVRTAEQTEVARFWADPPYVQNQRALRDYASARNLGALGTARLFSLADTAAADALIACWDAKYRVQFWRPFSAIPAGDTDGNPATPVDAAWRPLLATPNHPEYPSAHSCATTALGLVLAALDSGRLDLVMSSTTTGTTHHFTSVQGLVREVSNARVWGGIHWRFSTEDGTRIGRGAAQAVLAADHTRGRR